MQIQDSDVVGKTKQQLLAYVASKAETWMSSNLGTSNYASISAYDASISTSSPGWFRVALRVGFSDNNGNGVFDDEEDWDYHWKYQTCDSHGAWAAKEGGFFSWLDYDSNGIDPASVVWDKEESTWGYDSNLKYYQIKDLRTVSGWTEE